MDKLEKFILENRSGLDRLEPDPIIWSRINIKQVKSRRIIPEYLGKAAILVFIIASSFLLYNITTLNQTSVSGRTSSTEIVLSPDFVETEIYYNTRVKNLLREAKPMLISNPALESDLMTDISRLDSLCADIRRDLKDNISNHEVIEALVMNYRIKVQILEDMLILLHEHEKDNNDNRKQHEL